MYNRIFDEKSNSHTWDRVTKLEKGVIYYEGTVKILQQLTGWSGQQVLYFGDHPYSDLAGDFFILFFVEKFLVFIIKIAISFTRRNS